MLQPAPNAIEGSIIHSNINTLSANVKPGCAIISRNNYTLVKACFDLLSQGIRANIRGRDIGRRFLWRVDDWSAEAGSNSVSDLRRVIRSWCESVCEVLADYGRPTDKIVDEADSILRFCDGADNVDEVRGRIKAFFSDKTMKDMVCLTTAHKAKGLEWDDVLILKDTFKQGATEEETNIWYVAITRSKNSLNIITRQ
ncbi:MAG: ATP-binding domain-containing protein [Thioploca sp.]|nr:ATP-binding domain-containing protein [Thioploca sp.]